MLNELSSESKWSGDKEKHSPSVWMPANFSVPKISVLQMKYNNNRIEKLAKIKTSSVQILLFHYKLATVHITVDQVDILEVFFFFMVSCL